MSATVEQVRDYLVITPTVGRLDSVTAPAVDAQVAPHLKEPRRKVLLDLSSVTYVSSAGLRSILQLVKHTAAHQGRLALSGASPNVMEVIEISGFPGMMDIFPSREAATGEESK